MSIAELKQGDQIMHNGYAVKLLYRIRLNVWRVQPLFVLAEARDEIFSTHDRVSKIHTNYA